MAKTIDEIKAEIAELGKGAKTGSSAEKLNNTLIDAFTYTYKRLDGYDGSLNVIHQWNHKRLQNNSESNKGYLIADTYGAAHTVVVDITNLNDKTITVKGYIPANSYYYAVVSDYEAVPIGSSPNLTAWNAICLLEGSKQSYTPTVRSASFKVPNVEGKKYLLFSYTPDTEYSIICKDLILKPIEEKLEKLDTIANTNNVNSAISSKYVYDTNNVLVNTLVSNKNYGQTQQLPPLNDKYIVDKITIKLFSLGIKDIITPEDYGAVGDGITDDSEALKNMFNNANNKIVNFGANKTYLTTTYFNLKLKNTVINFNGSTLYSKYQFDSSVNEGFTLYLNNSSYVIINNLKFAHDDDMRASVLRLSYCSYIWIDNFKYTSGETLKQNRVLNVYTTNNHILIENADITVNTSCTLKDAGGIIGARQQWDGSSYEIYYKGCHVTKNSIDEIFWAMANENHDAYLYNVYVLDCVFEAYPTSDGVPIMDHAVTLSELNNPKAYNIYMINTKIINHGGLKYSLIRTDNPNTYIYNSTFDDSEEHTDHPSFITSGPLKIYNSLISVGVSNNQISENSYFYNCNFNIDKIGECFLSSRLYNCEVNINTLSSFVKYNTNVYNSYITLKNTDNVNISDYKMSGSSTLRGNTINFGNARWVFNVGGSYSNTITLENNIIKIKELAKSSTATVIANNNIIINPDYVNSVGLNTSKNLINGNLKTLE